MFRRMQTKLIRQNLIHIKTIHKIYVKTCSKPDLMSIPNLKLRLL